MRNERYNEDRRKEIGGREVERKNKTESIDGEKEDYEGGRLVESGKNLRNVVEGYSKKYGGVNLMNDYDYERSDGSRRNRQRK